MIADGWIDWAIAAPGIPDKVYSEPNKGLGLVGHSIVGSYQAALSRFMSTARDAQGRYTPNAAASVMFVLCKNGDLIQMYDIWSSTWTSGGYEANTSYWAIEAEGGPPSNPTEPFTEAQQATLLRLFDEYRAYTGRAVERGTTFREHGELAAELGYASTACPSHRYDWFTKQEDDMTPAEAEAIARRVFDEATPTYFVDLMKKYWCDVPVGDFSSMPDPDVVAAIAALRSGAIPEDAKRIGEMLLDFGIAAGKLAVEMKNIGDKLRK